MTSASGSATGRGPGGRTFEASAHTAASVDDVWPLIGQATRWKDWAWFTRASLVREGVPAPDGVGALRRFGLGPGGSTEEVVLWDPPHHLGYEARRGLPVRSYRADVYLEPEDGGTRVTWRCALAPLVPGTGAALAAVLRLLVASFARGVCRYADAVTGNGAGA